MQCKADSRVAPSQWETVLLCNGVSHCLCASLESLCSTSHKLCTQFWYALFWLEFISDLTVFTCCINTYSLRRRHTEHDGVSNHQPCHCLLNRLFRHRSKKTSNLRVTGLCAGNWPVTVNSPHKWPVTRKCFHLMTSSFRSASWQKHKHNQTRGVFILHGTHSRT